LHRELFAADLKKTFSAEKFSITQHNCQYLGID